MNLLLIANVHIYKDECGEYYSPSVMSYDFLKRYLSVFNQVTIVGKVHPNVVSGEGMLKVSGNKVNIVELPWYQGVKGLLLNFFKLFKIYRNILKNTSCCIYRCAQIESVMAYFIGGGDKLPYAIELVNDPKELKIPIFFKPIFLRCNYKMLKYAKGISYVTSHMLQDKYSKYCENVEFESYYSSVELEQSDINTVKRNFSESPKMYIVHVSNAINNDEKGHMTAINIIKFLKQRNILVKLDFIGDGARVPYYKKIIDDMGLNGDINFIGRIAERENLLKKMRQYDLLLFPTTTEGLPRVLIEAMSQGLPCLSTFVGGIPELLDDEYLFSPFDELGFVNKIEELYYNRNKLEAMSCKNIIVANEYTKEKLSERRCEFYKNLYEYTEKRGKNV